MMVFPLGILIGYQTAVFTNALLSLVNTVSCIFLFWAFNLKTFKGEDFFNEMSGPVGRAFGMPNM
jgi:hypothetical protein